MGSLDGPGHWGRSSPAGNCQWVGQPGRLGWGGQVPAGWRPSCFSRGLQTSRGPPKPPWPPTHLVLLTIKALQGPSIGGIISIHVTEIHKPRVPQQLESATELRCMVTKFRGRSKFTTQVSPVILCVTAECALTEDTCMATRTPAYGHAHARRHAYGHAYAHTHGYGHAHTRIQACTPPAHTHAHSHVCMHTYVHICTSTHIRAHCLHTCLQEHTHLHTHTHWCTHARRHTHTHTLVHHLHAHVYLHTHPCTLPLSPHLVPESVREVPERPLPWSKPMRIREKVMKARWALLS